MIDTDELRNDAKTARSGHTPLEVPGSEMLELLDRLEAAESDAAHQKALADSALRVAEGWEEKCNALRAKIAEMEKQEPVAFALYSGVAFKAAYLKEHEAAEQKDRRQLFADLGGPLEAYRVVPLYALPGAKGEDK